MSAIHRTELMKEVIEEYERGFTIEYIGLLTGITKREVWELLLEYKEQSKLPNSYSDDFKKMIAMRDMNDGVTRSSIAHDLVINANTVKKACEKFGQALKEKSISGQELTRIDGDFSKEKCPSCHSKDVNEIDDETFYCKKCGDEHIHKDGYILKVNYEWMEE